jgi:hypothetical protein
MSYWAISDLFLHILKRKTSKTCINNTNNTYWKNKRSNSRSSQRKKSQTIAKETIGSLFQKNCSQQYTSRSRSFYMCFWKPDMQRYHWDFYSLSYKESLTQKILFTFWDRGRLNYLIITSSSFLVKNYQCQLLKLRTQECINKKNIRCMNLSVSTTINSNYQVHWDLYTFKTYIKQLYVLN